MWSLAPLVATNHGDHLLWNCYRMTTPSDKKNTTRSQSGCQLVYPVQSARDMRSTLLP
jgi:hypothetical protein